MPPRQNDVSDGARPGGRDRLNSKGMTTRQIILERAEQLFAERGIAAVPLRDIGLAAGQKNNAAVQYHFGDRESLLKAIISYRASVSERVRAEILADLIAKGEPPQVRDLVKGFILSLASHLEDGNYYLAFLSRYIIEYGGYIGLEGSVSASTVNTFMSLLHRLLPEHRKSVLDERWMIVMTTTVHTLSRYQTAMQAGELPAPFHELLDDLADFLTGGVESTPQRTRGM
ncbi:MULTISPECIES: TetR/AcrR family transcriptional regulator [unclassified Parafrankia]|uniref:TetR/AcrR family transcriptional regulator n=1 Tax=unclassified Parafrankia TaxID=2994368 RepID=UPI000DD2E65E|nr:MULTISPECIES: TetR/AcrR family transcriptional regulator [unclassified Parafrankia]TCJ31825.1 TetR/AcrR family transcriptional regulator [Parafrankia sp. BMG5.11]